MTARLASGAPLESIVRTALQALREGTKVRGCSLWLTSDDGLIRAAEQGVDGATSAELAAALEEPDGTQPGLVVTPLLSGARRLGAITLVASSGALPSDGRLFLAAIADLLVLALLSSEQSRRFAAESALSTRELAAHHRFIERIVDSLPVGLYVIDREYRVRAWNRKRETGMQGVMREDALGRSIFDVLQRQPAEVLRREFDEVFESGALSQFEMQSSASGEQRTFRVSKIPMRLDDDQVTHVITIGEDITNWKRAQEQIAQAQKLAALGQLSAGVMHEINNPLATIGACAESIALQVAEAEVDPALRDAFSEYCRIIDHEVYRSKRIVDGLLDFSRPKVAARSDVDVTRVVQDTLFLLKHHVRFKRMTVETAFDQLSSCVVRGNAEQLLQVFMAMLLNAMDAMGEMGTIRIRAAGARNGAGVVVVEIVDQGHGIPASEIGKIFEPFYTTKLPGRGTGLGLSICYGIVADHGGRIEVDSTVGRGSTFRVILPAAGAA